MKKDHLKWFSSFIFIIVCIIHLTCCNTLNEDTAANKIRIASNHYYNSMLQNGYVAPAQYVEVARCGQAYCMFTLADGYLHSAGYDAIIPVANFNFVSSAMMKSNRTEPWYKTLTASYEAMPQFSYHSDVQPGIGSLFSAFRFFEKNGPLKNRSDYNFEFLDVVEENATNWIGIQFTPKINAQYKGVIWLDIKNNRITKIDFEAIPFYSQNIQRWVRAQGTFTYIIEQDYMAFQNIRFELKSTDFEYIIEINSSAPTELNRVVPQHEFSHLDQFQANPFVIYDSSRTNDLYTSFKWLDIDAFRTDLEIVYTLEEQFELNANRPYLYRKYHNGEIITLTNEEETYNFTRAFIRHFDGLSTSLKQVNLNSEPTIEVFIPQKRVLLGEVKAGTTVKAEFEIYNTGLDMLEIFGLSPDCVFKNVQNYSSKINPGDKTLVVAELNTTQLLGLNTSHITIETNTPTRFYNVSVVIDVVP